MNLFLVYVKTVKHHLQRVILKWDCWHNSENSFIFNSNIYCFSCHSTIQSKLDQLVFNLACCHVETVNIPLSLSASFAVAAVAVSLSGACPQI